MTGRFVVTLRVTVDRLDGQGGRDDVGQALVDYLAGASVDVEDDDGRVSVWEVDDVEVEQ